MCWDIRFGRVLVFVNCFRFVVTVASDAVLELQLEPCWADARLNRSRCCTSAEEEAEAQYQRNCFDSIFSKRECCTNGFALVQLPRAPPVPVGERNPSSAQLTWERTVRNATSLMTIETKMRPIVVRQFKRWKGEAQYVIEEQQHDLYRIGRAVASKARRWAVDLGANLGIVTMQLLRMDASLRVLAIEPSPSTFRYLQWNLRANGMANRCVALNIAIGKRDGVMSLFEHPVRHIESNLWGATDESWPEQASNVPVTSFENALRMADLLIDDVAFLKIDCEGCEWDLLGYQPLWTRLEAKQIALAAEVHQYMLPEGTAIREVKKLCPRATGATFNMSILPWVTTLCTRNLLPRS